MASRTELIKIILVCFFIIWAIRLSLSFDAFVDSFLMVLFAIMIYTSDYEK